MKIEFEPPKLEEEYYDERKLKKKYGAIFAENVIALLNAIELADNALDIKALPQYHMHLLHGDLYGLYSLSPDNKKSKFRVPVLCLDKEDNILLPGDNEPLLLQNNTKFRIKEICDYHDW